MRAAVLCMVAVAVVAAPVSASLGSAQVDECLRLTIAETSSDEASADIYISKFLPETGAPKHGDDLAPFLGEVLAEVERYLLEEAQNHELDSTPITVQVDVVVPASNSPSAPGHRVSLWLHVDGCLTP